MSEFKYHIIPSTIRERNALIKKEMAKTMQGKSFFTPCLNSLVVINANSVRETAYHASKTVTSTEYALNLPILLRHAVVREIDLPIISKRQKNMRIVRVATLICSMYNVNGTDGFAKITIGKKDDGNLIEYCVTAIEPA